MRRIAMIFDTVLFRGLAGVCVLLLIVMLLSVGVQVVMRYGFNSPLIWSEELARFMMVWLALLASAVVMRRGQHIAMTGILPIPKRFLSIVRGAVVLASALVLSVLVYHGWELAELTMRQHSSGLGLPMGYMYAAIPVSAFLMIIGQVAAWISGTGEGQDDSLTGPGDSH